MDQFERMSGATEGLFGIGGNRPITAYVAEIYDKRKAAPQLNEYTRYFKLNPDTAAQDALSVLNVGSDDSRQTKKIRLTPTNAANIDNIAVVVYEAKVQGYLRGVLHRDEIEKKDDGIISDAKIYKTYSLEEAASKYGIIIENSNINSKERRNVLTAVRKAVVDATKSCQWSDTRIDADDRDAFINGESNELWITTFDIFKPTEKHIPKDEGDQRLEEMNDTIVAGVKAGTAAIPSALKSKYKVDSDGDKTDAFIYIEAI